MTYISVTTDARTGKVTTRELTAEEIAARQARIAAMTPVPYSITPRQCRLILAQQGMLATVETIIAGMDEATKITWEYALEFRRDDPLLLGLATNLNLSPAQIDAFFIAAAQL